MRSSKSLRGPLVDDERTLNPVIAAQQGMCDGWGIGVGRIAVI
jgi:hypothetical protein